MVVKSPLRGIQAFRRRTDNTIGGSAGVVWTPALPTTDGGLLPEHWYRSDSGLWQDAGITPATADGAAVGRWEDLTANADHVNQAGGAFKPTLQNGAGDLLNGWASVRFDGIDDHLQGTYTTGGILTQPFIYFVVANLNVGLVDDGNYHALMDSSTGATTAQVGQRPIVGADNWGMWAGGAVQGGASNANWNIWTALFNGATSQLWHNGISTAGPGNAGANNPVGLTIGDRAVLGQRWGGNVTEVLIYEANLSNADKNQIGQYLASRYALAYTDI